MSESLGGIWFELEAQSGNFMRDMDAAKKQFEKTQEAAEKLGEIARNVGIVMGAFGAAIVTSMGLAVVSLAKTADGFDEMSARTGVSVKALQELTYVAKLSGGSAESMEVSFKKMAMVITTAGEGMKTAKDSLEKLNLRFHDLAKLSPEEQFNALAGAISDIKDPTARAAAAVDIFGRSGTALLPMLSGGREGLAKMREEAGQFSTVLTGDAAKAAAELGDDIDRLKMGFRSLWDQLAIALLPTVKEWVATAKNVIIETKTWIKDNQELFNNIVKITGVVGLAATAIGTLLTSVGLAIAAVGKASVAIGVLKGMFDTLYLTILSNPFLGWAAAMTVAVTALSAFMVKAQDAKNANINMGGSIAALIKMHEAEAVAIRAKITQYETSLKYTRAGTLEEKNILEKLSQEKDRLARTETAIEAQKNRQIEIDKKKHHTTMLADDKKSNADRLAEEKRAAQRLQNMHQADFDWEREANAGMHSSLSTSFMLYAQTMQEQTLNYYTELQRLGGEFQASLSTGFSVMFANITDGWSAFAQGLQAFAGAIRDAIIKHVSDIAAAWVVKHTVMALASALWGKKEIAVNASVAGSKAAAASGWAVFGAIAIGAAVMAGVMALAGKFEHGGIVGGNSYTGDHVIAAVNSGEMILNQGQQARLFDAANGRGAGGQQTIVVNLDGKVLAKATAQNFPAILRLYGAAT